MRILKKYIREIIKENNARSFISEVYSTFQKTNERHDDVPILEDIFENGCKVQFAIDITHSGYAYIDFIETLDSHGRENINCFRKGYARSTMGKIIQIADNTNTIITLEVESSGRRTPNNTQLQAFYRSLGFEEYYLAKEIMGMIRYPE